MTPARESSALCHMATQLDTQSIPRFLRLTTCLASLCLCSVL